MKPTWEKIERDGNRLCVRKLQFDNTDPETGKSVVLTHDLYLDAGVSKEPDSKIEIAGEIITIVGISHPPEAWSLDNETYVKSRIAEHVANVQQAPPPPPPFADGGSLEV